MDNLEEKLLLSQAQTKFARDSHESYVENLRKELSPEFEDFFQCDEFNGNDVEILVAKIENIARILRNNGIKL